MRYSVRRAVATALWTGAAAATLSPAIWAAENQEPVQELEEIVITAQFRQERLQEAPLAISAISGEDLAERSIKDVSQIAQAVPNVSLDRTSSAFGPSIGAFIRGVGQGDFNYNFEPGVGMYVDDLYHATLMGSLFQLVDLERVEVLRGPQGTLFGKNSIGGAIRLIPQKPRGDNSAYIEATYGAYDRKELRAMFDIPLIDDKLFLRASAMSQNVNGFVKRLDFVCANPDYGLSKGFAVNTSAPRLLTDAGYLRRGSCEIGTEGGSDIQGGRVALRWLAREDVEVNLAADWTRDNSEAAPIVLKKTDTGGPQYDGIVGATLNPPGALQQYFFDTYGVYWDDRFLTGNNRSNYATFHDLDRDLSLPPVNGIESWGGSLTVDWDISNTMHLKSITGYRAYSGAWSDDQDATPMPMAWVHNQVDHHAFSQEFQLTGTLFDGKLDYATGVFYMDALNRNRGRVGINALWFLGSPAQPGGGGLTFPLDDPSNVEDIAGFLNLDYHVTDQLTLHAGGRYTDEDKDYTFWHVAPPVLVLDNVRQESGYSRWDYKFGVDYKWTPDLMTYASVATGFKGGGLNPRPFSSNQVVAFGPETMTSYELGLKSQWFDRKLTANVALFYSRYEDLQLTSSRPDANGAPFVGPTNVGREDLSGIEIELFARPIRGLEFNLGFGYTDAEFKDLGNAIGCAGLPSGVAPVPAPAAGSNCVNGGPLLSDTPGGAPWRGNIGVQYQGLLSNGGTITPRLDFSYRTHPPYGNSNEAFTDTRVKSLGLLNGRVTWANAAGDWSVALYATNLLDKDYILNYFDMRTASEAHAVGQPGRPREWGVTLRKSF